MADCLSYRISQFLAGSEAQAYQFLGCHREQKAGIDGYVFRVWSPHALHIQLTGSFLLPGQFLPLKKIEGGIWEIWISSPQEGDTYNYIVTGSDGISVRKTDPFGFCSEKLPGTASIVRDIHYVWNDNWWFASQNSDPFAKAMNIYEIHIGSWRKKADGSFFTYRELAPVLADYLKDMGYTHVEFLPLTEHPFDPSWGYQVTGYFCPTSRYGSPEDLMFLIDTLHQNGIGVILDWVPAHFPKDLHGLFEFDGTYTYEPSDSEKNEHSGWGTRLFDLGKPEVRSFLVSSAFFWLKEYHFDFIRVDAVGEMLYPNSGFYQDGRTEPPPLNSNAITFFRDLNTACHKLRNSSLLIAEDSTAFPAVTTPVSQNGLGFMCKWNMGWMHDTLQYMESAPCLRNEQHHLLTFSMTYAFSEHYILPLSHDEVVHGKRSLLSKTSCEEFWQFAQLRSLLAYQTAHPGKKLNFMGNELGQSSEWDYRQQLSWELLEKENHRCFHHFVRNLNHFYLENSMLWEADTGWDGYQWIQPDDHANSILAFRRIDRSGKELICVCNFSTLLHERYYLGVPFPGMYSPVFSSDSREYGGTGTIVPAVTARRINFRQYSYAAEFTIPPMSVTFYTNSSP